MKDDKTFGRIIAEARKKLKISQKELAEKLSREDEEGSISPQYLNDIEHDRRTPPSLLINQFARILSMDKDYLHFLAGRIPNDLRIKVGEKKFRSSMQAFRKSLEPSKKRK